MQPLCLDVGTVISSFLQRTTGTGGVVQHLTQPHTDED